MSDAVGLERVVAQDPARQPLVGDHDPLLGQRAQDREVQPHVLDDAVVVLEGDPVADAQRLGEGEHDPGHEVGERLARREADDRRGEGARGEQAGGQLLEPGELARRAEDAEHDDHQPHEPPDEAQPRVGLLRDPAPQHPRRRACGRGRRTSGRRRRRAGSSRSASAARRSTGRCRSRSPPASWQDRPAWRRSLEPSCSTRWAPCSPSSRRRRTCGRGCSSGPAWTSARRRPSARSARRSRTTAPTCTRAPTRRGWRRCGARARRRCAPRSACDARTARALTEALLGRAALPRRSTEVPATLAALRAARDRARGGLQLGRLAARAPGRDGPRAAARRRGRVGGDRRREAGSGRSSRPGWSWPARRRRRRGTRATRRARTSRARAPRASRRCSSRATAPARPGVTAVRSLDELLVVFDVP